MPHAPTCGPETIAWTGLTVNGCSSPIGPAGQIAIARRLTDSYFTCGAAVAERRLLLGRLRPDLRRLLRRGDLQRAVRHADREERIELQVAGARTTHRTRRRTPSTARSPLTNNSLNVNQNDTGITKLQYTYALSQSAYLARVRLHVLLGLATRRLRSTAPPDELRPAFTGAAQYQLITHTAGGALDFQDQLNDQNLITLDGNYTTADVIRFNNTTALRRHVADRLYVRRVPRRLHVLRQPTVTVRQARSAMPCPA